MLKYQKILVGALMVFITVFFFGLGLRAGNNYLMALPALIFVGIFAVSKPELLFLGGIALWQSSMVLPGFPNQLQLYHVFLLGASLIVLLRVVITKERLIADGPLRVIVGLYGLVTFYTMMARGVGFSVVGTDQIGGMRYVMIYVGVLGLWFLPNIRVSRSALKKALYGYALLGFLPAIAEFIFIVSGGAVYHQYYFVKIGASLGSSFAASMMDEGVRYTSASALGRGLALLPFLILPFKPKNYVWYGILILSALVTLSFTGYRSQIASMVLTLFITLFVLFKSRRKEFVAFSVAAGIAVYIGILLSFEYLPFGLQRAFSFLPGLQSRTSAVIDASASTNFRFGVWDMAVREIPEYLWLGKGLTYSYSEFMALNMYGLSGKHFEIGLLSNLHNGPLEALVYFGLPGFILFTAFTFRVILLTIRLIKTRNPSSRLDPLFLFLASYIFVTFFLWWLSFGNAYNSLLQISILFILISKMHESGQGESKSEVHSIAQLEGFKRDHEE